MEQEKIFPPKADQPLAGVLTLPLQISELAQILLFGVISVLSFFAPFLLGHPQWLVGTIVNACLFLAAIFLDKKYFLPIAVLPSLGLLARGIAFGPLTMFLVYFLPFIWLGNFILILVFKSIYSNIPRNNGIVYFVAGGAAALTKFLALFLMANIYFNLHWAPKLFLQAMGLNQLATALAGGLIAFCVFNLISKNGKR